MIAELTKPEVPGQDPRLIEFLTFGRGEAGSIDVGGIGIEEKTIIAVFVTKTVANLAQPEISEQAFSFNDLRESLDWFNHRMRITSGKPLDPLPNPTGSGWWWAQRNRMHGFMGSQEELDMITYAYPLSQLIDKWIAVGLSPLEIRS